MNRVYRKFRNETDDISDIVEGALTVGIFDDLSNNGYKYSHRRFINDILSRDSDIKVENTRSTTISDFKNSINYMPEIKELSIQSGQTRSTKGRSRVLIKKEKVSSPLELEIVYKDDIFMSLFGDTNSNVKNFNRMSLNGVAVFLGKYDMYSILRSLANAIMIDDDVDMSNLDEVESVLYKNYDESYIPVQLDTKNNLVLTNLLKNIIPFRKELETDTYRTNLNLSLDKVREESLDRYTPLFKLYKFLLPYQDENGNTLKELKIYIHFTDGTQMFELLKTSALYSAIVSISPSVIDNLHVTDLNTTQPIPYISPKTLMDELISKVEAKKTEDGSNEVQGEVLNDEIHITEESYLSWDSEDVSKDSECMSDTGYDIEKVIKGEDDTNLELGEVIVEECPIYEDRKTVYSAETDIQYLHDVNNNAVQSEVDNIINSQSTNQIIYEPYIPKNDEDNSNPEATITSGSKIEHETMFEPSISNTFEPVIESAVEPSIEPSIEQVIEPATESVVESITKPEVELDINHGTSENSNNEETTVQENKDKIVETEVAVTNPKLKMERARKLTESEEYLLELWNPSGEEDTPGFISFGDSYKNPKESNL